MTNSSPINQLEQTKNKLELNLRDSAISSARLDADLILCHVLDKPRSWVLSHPEYMLTEKEAKKVALFAEERTTGVPLAYITNEREFYGRSFYVDNRVLVPRPESEDIITIAIENITSNNMHVIDVGCGSGILGITLSLEKPGWEISLSDISQKAIDVAKTNALAYDVKDKLSFIKADLIPVEGNYDLVVANLPYVPNSYKQVKTLSKEPKIALFSGDYGLDHYKKLFKQIGDMKNKPSYIVTESLKIQHTEIIKMANIAGYRLEKHLGLAQLFILNN